MSLQTDETSIGTLGQMLCALGDVFTASTTSDFAANVLAAVTQAVPADSAVGTLVGSQVTVTTSADSLAATSDHSEPRHRAAVSISIRDDASFCVVLERKDKGFSDADLDCLEALRCAIEAGTSRAHAVRPISSEQVTQYSVNGILTRREADVVALLREGLTDRQIALRLTISPRTVGKHLEHVYFKTGVRTRTQVMAAHHRGATSGSALR